MSSPNILLTRIDNRLVHGQVGITWTSTIGANLLVVVDDVVANDDIRKRTEINRYYHEKPTALAFVSLLSKKPLTSSGKAAPH